MIVLHKISALCRLYRFFFFFFFNSFLSGFEIELLKILDK
jgi:hypothetical protein